MIDYGTFLVGAGPSTGSYHSKRKTVSGGSWQIYAASIGKSKASGIHKGHLHHLQQCKNDTGGSDPCNEKAEAEGKTTVRLHTGDPCIYGAIRGADGYSGWENIAYDYCPGVSAFFMVLRPEFKYTLPDISQSVIITRMEGRTPGSVQGKHSVICGSSGNYGCILKYRNAGRAEQTSIEVWVIQQIHQQPLYISK